MRHYGISRAEGNFSTLKNFKYLDELIHSGVNEIILDSNVILDSDEQSKYFDGIALDICDIVIDGAGHTIDGCGKTRIFKNTAQNVTVKNVILKNGFSNEYGGAICNLGELTVQNSAISNNQAFCGGAICNNNKLKIIDSALSFNIANRKESAGGAIYNEGVRLDIKGSQLSCNLANWGGAIFSEDSVMNLTCCEIFSNSSRDGGGAIYAESGDLNIHKSSLWGNVSNLDGGAIWNQQAHIAIFDSKLSSNKSRHFSGAIECYEGKLEIFNSLFSDNTAEYGGNAIFIKWCKNTLTSSSRGWIAQKEH